MSPVTTFTYVLKGSKLQDPPESRKFIRDLVVVF